MSRKSAVPFERLFSSAGYIVNKMRSSLTPNTANMLVCLLVGYLMTFEQEMLVPFEYCFLLSFYIKYHILQI